MIFNSVWQPVDSYWRYRILTPSDKDGFSNSKIEITGQVALKQQQRIMQAINHFWEKMEGKKFTRFKGMLSKHLQTRVIDVEKRDIVHIYEDNQKRNRWPLGVIKRVIKTSEGEICRTQMRIVEKNKKPVTISRPVKKLYPLELDVDEQRSTSSLDKKDERKNH